MPLTADFVDQLRGEIERHQSNLRPLLDGRHRCYSRRDGQTEDRETTGERIAELTGFIGHLQSILDGDASAAIP